MVLNLTQHKASADQVQAGVFDPTGEDAEKMRGLLTFQDLPMKGNIEEKAEELADLALRVAGRRKKVMIGGAPYLMSPLERELKARGLTPVYAFSQRVSEEKEVDGEVVKTQIFKHLGFVEV